MSFAPGRKSNIGGSPSEISLGARQWEGYPLPRQVYTHPFPSSVPVTTIVFVTFTSHAGREGGWYFALASSAWDEGTVTPANRDLAEMKSMKPSFSEAEIAVAVEFLNLNIILFLMLDLSRGLLYLGFGILLKVNEV